ncbi:ABC transporter ATP-binding protein [Pirellulales bacterium]|nr:ABC transporter ATP-binding protein [Pirellulales bacterium]
MLLTAQSLTKRFGQVEALCNCSIAADRGEVLGLLGPNGAGKTTFLRLLLGFLKPTSGSAHIDGFDCYRQPVSAHRRLAYLPGEVRLISKLTGRGCLEFFTQLRPAGALQPALKIAQRLDLDLSRRVGQMSTGMRQKLALAIALAPDVPLTVLDEPTANLDPNARRIVLELVRECRDAGNTVLFSSHVLGEVEEACDRAALLRGGRLVEEVTLAEIRGRRRIRMKLTGPLTPPPEAIARSIEVDADDRAATVLAEGDLAPLLKWLAEQPIAELQIEAAGLRTVYERVHPATGSPATVAAEPPL